MATQKIIEELIVLSLLGMIYLAAFAPILNSTIANYTGGGAESRVLNKNTVVRIRYRHGARSRLPAYREKIVSSTKFCLGYSGNRDFVRQSSNAGVPFLDEFGGRQSPNFSPPF